MHEYLPREFLERMRHMLGSEYEDFLKSYEQTALRGLRLNLKKWNRLSVVYPDFWCWEERFGSWGLEQFVCPAPKQTETSGQFKNNRGTAAADLPAPAALWLWKDEALRAQGIQPGKHPYHEGGLYYIQEPSAMQVVPMLGIRPWDRVLDMCAAPGGKALQAADLLERAAGGLLVANEFVARRAQILLSNTERMGADNVLVLNESGERLAAHFPEYFTRIILDAPCSGEGMFRKDADSIAEWRPDKPTQCAQLQRQLLAQAASMLAPGGRMSYSTCTFAVEENEAVVEAFLAAHPDFTLCEQRRIWPHREVGEGHFIAILQKRGFDGAGMDMTDFMLEPSEADIPGNESGSWCALRRLKLAGRLYLQPESFPDVRGLHVLRSGLLLGEEKKGRFEPSHASALAAELEDRREDIAFEPTDERIYRYLRGEELALSETGENAWVDVSLHGLRLGLGKRVGQRLKNHYPKGLRWV